MQPRSEEGECCGGQRLASFKKDFIMMLNTGSDACDRAHEHYTNAACVHACVLLSVLRRLRLAFPSHWDAEGKSSRERNLSQIFGPFGQWKSTGEHY